MQHTRSNSRQKRHLWKSAGKQYLENSYHMLQEGLGACYEWQGRSVCWRINSSCPGSVILSQHLMWAASLPHKELQHYQENQQVFITSTAQFLYLWLAWKRLGNKWKITVSTVMPSLWTPWILRTLLKVLIQFLFATLPFFLFSFFFLCLSVSALSVSIIFHSEWKRLFSHPNNTFT